ncbi:hypothetical protein DFH09DRAFT_653216 [Mycena vulgaris]|nr:hypothetical protein DFH09DRAFT_653216 [Mycena vulgaris]
MTGAGHDSSPMYMDKSPTRRSNSWLNRCLFRDISFCKRCLELLVAAQALDALFDESHLFDFGHVLPLFPRQQLFPVDLALLQRSTETEALDVEATAGVQVFCVDCVSRTNYSVGIMEVSGSGLKVEAAHINVTVQQFEHDINLEISLDGSLSLHKSGTSSELHFRTLDSPFVTLVVWFLLRRNRERRSRHYRRPQFHNERGYLPVRQLILLCWATRILLPLDGTTEPLFPRAPESLGCREAS